MRIKGLSQLKMKGVDVYHLFANRLGNRLLNVFPKSTFINLNRHSEKLFFLSFDCDNELDTKSLKSVGDSLNDMQIKASFAVVGEILKLDPDPYLKLLKDGHEIINHGYTRHTVFNEKSGYAPCFFYNDIDAPRIEFEVEKNQAVIRDVLGVEPQGFRVPHFGTYQSKNEIAQLYQILEKSNLQYSSSILKIYQKSFGLKSRIVEFPLTGLYKNPIYPIDSWGLIEKGSDAKFNEQADYLRAINTPLLVNIYVDPAHVVDYPSFWSLLKTFQSLGYRFSTYQEYLSHAKELNNA